MSEENETGDARIELISPSNKSGQFSLTRQLNDHCRNSEKNHG